MPNLPELERQLSRFKRLPQLDDVWEGAIAQMPMWVDGEPGKDPYRPQAPVWVSTGRQLAHFKLTDAQGRVDDAVALATLAEMGTSAKLAGYRPRALRVRDERLASSLAEALQPLDTAVEVVRDLPVLDKFLQEMTAGIAGDRVPAALDAPGVTPERLRAFADAAKQFYDSAPWRHLDDGDLIRVETPNAGKGLVLCAVMGAAGQQFGLGFFSSVDQYHAILDDAPPEELFENGGEWAIYFSPPWETAFADLAAWDRHSLPLASNRGYPTAVRLDPSRDPQRPDAGRLAYFEGLLRAIAATTEDEMDSGRWSHRVETADGVTKYVLTLPDLLQPRLLPTDPGALNLRSMERLTSEISRALGDQKFDSLEAFNDAIEERFGDVRIDDRPSTAATPLEQAQDLIYEAFEARGRRQLLLIRRALDLSPDCADAYVLLAERSSSLDEQRSLYEQALDAGERALGAGAFEDSNRTFWGDVATRPYMRARLGLAECLSDQGELDAAVGHFRALLQLNPDDNQSVRYLLLTLLLRENRNDEATALLDEHDEADALWSYASVLLALRARDPRLARTRLRVALKSNRHVPRYLTGQRELPDDDLPAAYTLGSDDEAVWCASELIEPWTGTPDAIAWLRAETRGRR
jgi:tetratricopeptide (TPR) repeat protein